MVRQEHVDASALSGALRQLEPTGARQDIESALKEVCLAAAEMLAVNGSGILLIDEGRVQRSTVASDHLGELLEVHQETVGEGPCVDAMMNDEVVCTTDVGNDDRFFDLDFGAVQRDPIGEVKRLYAWLGEPVTAEFERGMQEWWRVAAASRLPNTHPDASAFGLRMEAVRPLFADYVARTTAWTAPARRSAVVTMTGVTGAMVMTTPRPGRARSSPSRTGW